MRPEFPMQFEREHGCTEAEWLGWLPGAVRNHALDTGVPGQASVTIHGGSLSLQWHALEPRRLGLARFPRLMMRYRFDGLDANERATFMRYFDLYMQRGGG
ncbi:MAG: hypothetical protein IPP44_10125 [Ideonella sp.]|nr:hypothetical protein [Ideonella sp.]